MEVSESDEVEADVGAGFVVEVEDGKRVCPRPRWWVDEVECCAFAIDEALKREEISVVVEIAVRNVPRVVEEENVGNIGLFFLGKKFELLGWTEAECFSLFLALEVSFLAGFKMC